MRSSSAKATVPTSGDLGETGHGLASPLLEIIDLRVSIGGTSLIRGASFAVDRGEIVGLVGESGSGKTLTGLSVLGLTPPGAQIAGRIEFLGCDLLQAEPESLRRLRGNELSMIFQEPQPSLHPALAVGRQIVDVVRAHENVRRRVAERRALDLLAEVGMPNPRACLTAYPHELSGGMCQRVMIAMALVCGPSFLIADEPTTALDVTIQAQIITLLRTIAREHRLAVLLITHNLGIVSEICDRVVTMYCGEVVNVDSTDGLLRQPRHPYPWALLQAARDELEQGEDWGGIGGQPANPAHPPSGCGFHPRCPFAVPECARVHPEMTATGTGALTRCIRQHELELEGLAV